MYIFLLYLFNILVCSLVTAFTSTLLIIGTIFYLNRAINGIGTPLSLLSIPVFIISAVAGGFFGFLLTRSWQSSGLEGLEYFNGIRGIILIIYYLIFVLLIGLFLINHYKITKDTPRNSEISTLTKNESKLNELTEEYSKYFPEQKSKDFIRAVIFTDFQTMEKMLEEGFDINQTGFIENKNNKTKYYRNPLIVAGMIDNIESFKYLLEKGANVNMKIGNVRLAEFFIDNKNLYYMNKMIESGLDINKRDKYDRTTLVVDSLYSSNQDDDQLFRLLVENGGDINEVRYNLEGFALSTVYDELQSRMEYKIGNHEWKETWEYYLSKGGDINIRKEIINK